MNYNYFTGITEEIYDKFTTGGVYLVGTCIFNPLKEDEKYYWIKVGKAQDFGKRMRNYHSCNPMVWKGAFLPCSGTHPRHVLELTCHDILKQESLGTHSKASEWYEVSKETYLKICKEGFLFFKNYPLFDLYYSKETNWYINKGEVFDKILWEKAVQAS